MGTWEFVETIQRKAIGSGAESDVRIMSRRKATIVGAYLLTSFRVEPLEARQLMAVTGGSINSAPSFAQYEPSGLSVTLADYRLTVRPPTAQFDQTTTTVSQPAPTNVAVSNASTFPAVLVKWADSVNGETGFIIERSGDGGVTFSEVGRAPAGATEYWDANSLSTARFYFYRVRAFGTGWVTLPSTSAKATTASLNPTFTANWNQWRVYDSGSSNPFLKLLETRYSGTNKFVAPKSVTNAWDYQQISQELMPLAYTAGDPRSSLKGRIDVVNYTIQAVDWLLGQTDSSGRWWTPTIGRTGDVNVNRMVLLPVLEAVQFVRNTSAGQAAWARWQTKLSAAVEFQRQSYAVTDPTNWTWSEPGKYANQDAYYMVIMTLSSKAFNRPSDLTVASDVMKTLTANLLPSGGLHYVGGENDVPVYHMLDILLIARYADLSKDPLAYSTLKKTADYYPLTATDEGAAETWSTAWWKPRADLVNRQALVVAAGATDDPRNQWMLLQVLSRTTPSDDGMWAVYSAPFWKGLSPTVLPSANNYITYDENARGFRGRDGTWYYGAVQGRGTRSSFVGATISSPTATNPIQGVFNGAQIDVLYKSTDAHGLWLSSSSDVTSVTLQPGNASVLGVRYMPQPTQVNGAVTPVTYDRPWQVTEVWRAAGDGLIGNVTLEATSATTASDVVGRLVFGTDPIVAQADGTYIVGGMRVKLFQKFGTTSVKPVAEATSWNALEMRKALTGGVTKGTRFQYTAWIGPVGATPPSSVTLLTSDAGFVAQWASGKSAAALFNPTSAALSVQVATKGQIKNGWTGQSGTSVSAWTRLNTPATISLSAHQTALVDMSK